MAYALILGATSDMAKAVVRRYAKEGYDFYLAARKPDDLADFATELSQRYTCSVSLHQLDILDTATHKAFYETLSEEPELVFSFVGLLGDQKQAEQDNHHAELILASNFTALVSMLSIIAASFERRGSGALIVVSSVAGDRGRQSNYIYGAAKAGLTAYLSGLRNRLFKSGVHVLTVKPGFVATKMTAALQLPKLLTASPDTVAKAIYKAQLNKQNVLYTMSVWRYILFVIRLIPEGLFKRLSL